MKLIFSQISQDFSQTSAHKNQKNISTCVLFCEEYDSLNTAKRRKNTRRFLRTVLIFSHRAFIVILKSRFYALN